MRKTRTWIGNAYKAGRGYSCEAVLGLDNSKQYVTNGQTNGKWFDRFMKGARLCMGMVRKQNEALTSLVALAVCREAEHLWKSPSSTEATRTDLENTVGFMLIAMGGGLRGEEVPLLSLDGILTFWETTSQEPDPFIMMTLKGRFKGEVDERWHMVPVSDHTRSGLPTRKWMQRILNRRVIKDGRSGGWLFQSKNGTRYRFGMYDATFRQLLDAAREEDCELLPRFQPVEVTEAGSSVGDHEPRRLREGHRTNQQVAEEGSS